MDDIMRELRESASLKVHVAETQGASIQAMIECIWESMQQGGKLLICGNGGSAADAQHWARNVWYASRQSVRPCRRLP